MEKRRRCEADSVRCFPPPRLAFTSAPRHPMARRAIASAAQLRELDGAWEKVATELGDAVAFAVSQRAKDPLAAIVEHLVRTFLLAQRRR